MGLTLTVYIKANEIDEVCAPFYICNYQTTYRMIYTFHFWTAAGNLRIVERPRRSSRNPHEVMGVRDGRRPFRVLGDAEAKKAVQWPRAS